MLKSIFLINTFNLILYECTRKCVHFTNESECKLNVAIHSLTLRYRFLFFLINKSNILYKSD